jgi:phage shock protein A
MPDERLYDQRLLDAALEILTRQASGPLGDQDRELLPLIAGYVTELNQRIQLREQQIQTLRSWWTQQQSALVSAQLSLREAQHTLSELRSQLAASATSSTRRSATRATQRDAASSDPRQSDIFEFFMRTQRADPIGSGHE